MVDLIIQQGVMLETEVFLRPSHDVYPGSQFWKQKRSINRLNNVVIYEAPCFDVAQGLIKKELTETRTQSCKLANHYITIRCALD